MSSARVTIQDVADKLGLSKFSVSRALSGKPGVGEATRARVLRAAHVMGYRIGADMAHAVEQILFVRQEIDPMSSELWLNLLHGAEAEAERLGYAIVPRQARFLSPSGATEPGIVGLILATMRPGDIAELAIRTGLPVVCASFYGGLERMDQVVGADWEASMAVARMLTGLGHRNAAFVHANARPLARSERFRGFRDGMLEVPGAIVEDIAFDAAAGFRPAFLDYLRNGGAATALFCANDGIAVNVVSELLRLGIDVPRDVSVVGFNDLAAAGQIAPRLTTVRTPLVDMGAMMVRCIVDRLSGPEQSARAPMRIALASEIVRRESTGPASPPLWRERVASGAVAAE